MNTTSSSPSAVLPFRFNAHEVRALAINGEPWFVAKDVCDVLEIVWKGSETVAFLDDDEKGVRKFRTPSGGPQEMIIISESGLYTLIIRSNKPQARPFRKWVTAEVLPSIRRTGGYTAEPQDGGNRTDIFHHRGPCSASGLDIRYTLDLTKILVNPTARSLALLERLSGVQLADLGPAPAVVPHLTGVEKELARIDAFARERLEVGNDGSVLFADLYLELLSWWRDHCPEAVKPGPRALSAWVTQSGLPRDKRGGRAFVHGVRLLVEVVA